MAVYTEVTFDEAAALFDSVGLDHWLEAAERYTTD